MEMMRLRRIVERGKVVDQITLGLHFLRRLRHQDADAIDFRIFGIKDHIGDLGREYLIEDALQLDLLDRTEPAAGCLQPLEPGSDDGLPDFPWLPVIPELRPRHSILP